MIFEVQTEAKPPAQVKQTHCMTNLTNIFLIFSGYVHFFFFFFSFFVLSKSYTFYLSYIYSSTADLQN